MKVKGKVCVVTGAAGGIGEAIARRYAKEGAKGVVVADRHAGLLASMGSAPYGVTKHAGVALAEHLSIQYGDKGIAVSVLCPQAVDTNMLRMAGSTAASVDGVLNTDAVAQTVIEAMDAETFLILPHPEVKEYMARKLDRDRWLRGMQRLRDKTGEGQRKRS